jgi:hypothetical protein
MITESFLSKKSSERGLTRRFLFRSAGVGRDALPRVRRCTSRRFFSADAFLRYRS